MFLSRKSSLNIYRRLLPVTVSFSMCPQTSRGSGPIDRLGTDIKCRANRVGARRFVPWLKRDLRDQEQGVDGQRRGKQHCKKARVLFHPVRRSLLRGRVVIRECKSFGPAFYGCISIIFSIGIMFCVR